MKYTRFKRSQHGAALVEFALVLPILLGFAIGIIYYGYVYMLDAAVTHAAKQGAQVAVNIDPVDFASTGAFQSAVTTQVTTSVINSLSWLPATVRTLAAPTIEFSAPPDGRAGTLVDIQIIMNVTGGTSPLLRQFDLPVIGKVPPLPLTLNGLAQVVL